jgi:hypothetical protein
LTVREGPPSDTCIRRLSPGFGVSGSVPAPAHKSLTVHAPGPGAGLRASPSALASATRTVPASQSRVRRGRRRHSQPLRSWPTGCTRARSQSPPPRGVGTAASGGAGCGPRAAVDVVRGLRHGPHAVLYGGRSGRRRSGRQGTSRSLRACFKLTAALKQRCRHTRDPRTRGWLFTRASRRPPRGPRRAPPRGGGGG